MTSKPIQLPEALEQHLASSKGAGLAGVGRFIEKGALLVTDVALAVLREQRLSLQMRTAALGDHERLRGRLELLAAVFHEASAGAPMNPRSLREIAFALIYFLRNADRIPDDVPQVGLVDDAVVAQFVLQRQAAAVGACARRRGWAVPSEVG